MTLHTRTQRLPWILGVALLCGTALGAGWLLNRGTASVGGAGDTQTAAAPALVVCIGQVDADPGIAKLYPLAQGRVVEVVAEGRAVKQGDVLLRLDSRLAQYKLAEAEADLAAGKELEALAKRLPEQHRRKKDQQQSALDAVRHQRESTFNEYKVKEQLFHDKVLGINVKTAYEEMVKKLDAMVKVEESKLEELKLFDARPQADLNRAAADVAAKQARAHQAALAFKECSLPAPADGTVLLVLVHAGEILGPYPSVPVIQFRPRGRKIVRAEVLQEWASRVKEGQEVVIEDDTFAGATWQGKVERVSDWFSDKRHKIFEPFMVNDVRTMECLIALTSDNEALRIGQRVRVKIKQ